MAIDYMTEVYAPTLKEVPAEAQIRSHQLLLRAGYVRKLASGLYVYLPLAMRSLRKIEDIIRTVLDAHGAQEVQLPVLGPSELWEESGRADAYGPELMKMQDRHERTFVLGPTHEEIMCDLVRGELTSYKQLPVNLYQITDKFRDELRPRFGLMRGREFIMKDGYSFDADQEGMQKTYDTMYEAYAKIFSAMGLKTLPVAADSGQIGGSSSIEFMALAQEGEAEVLWCDCDFAADVEAASATLSFEDADTTSELTEVSTPGAKSIEDVARTLDVSKRALVKAIALITETYGPVVLFVPGDHSVNEIKMQREFGNWRLMEADELKAHQLVEGFIGPKNLPATVRAFKDVSLSNLPYWISGANKKDTHLKGLQETRDFPEISALDVISAEANDLCPSCNAPLKSARGIEVGQIFQLADKYSKPMEAMYLDENQKTHYFQMGCYGIGVSRTLQALVAEYNDDRGIIWPLPVAPYAVEIINLAPKEEEIAAYVQKMAEAIHAKRFDVLIDERDLRPGPKFKDAELIGMPYQVIIGTKGFQNGTVEFVKRKTMEKQEIDAQKAAEQIIDVLTEAKGAFGAH